MCILEQCTIFCAALQEMCIRDRVYGTLYIEVGKGSGTSSKGDLTYQVDPDDDVTLDAEDFYDFFYDESDYDELEYVEFTDYDDFDDYGCFYADGYDSDDYTRDYELNDSDLDDAVFYYDEMCIRDMPGGVSQPDGHDPAADRRDGEVRPCDLLLQRRVRDCVSR